MTLRSSSPSLTRTCLRQSVLVNRSSCAKTTSDRKTFVILKYRPLRSLHSRRTVMEKWLEHLRIPAIQAEPEVSTQPRYIA